MRFKNALKKFAYETFRPHSKDEYAELFLRGRGGDEKTPYPWFYARVLLIGFLLFAVLCISFSLSEIDFLLVLFAGGIFADLTFIVLLFEIYPKRDLPLITPVLTLIAGGILASAFIYIFYGIANFSSQPFIDQAWIALVEETGKALAIFIILFIVKKRNPFVGFIIGAAVGGGYSAFENMWRMYTQGFAWGGLSSSIEIGLWRALGTPFSHAAWAGAFGWALGGKKPWLTWKPYAMYAFGYTMHFFVNFPLMSKFDGWNGYAISAVTGILSIALIIILIIKSRRELTGFSSSSAPERLRGYPKINGEHVLKINGEYSTKINGTYAEISVGEAENSIGYGGQRYKFIANVLAAAAIFCFSLSLLGPTCIFGGYVNYKTYYYDNWQDVLYIVQAGLEFNPDYGRKYVEYDDLSQNYSYTWTDGELTSVIQREQYGDYCYRFSYGYTLYDLSYYPILVDEDGNYFVTINGEDYILEVVDGEAQQSIKLWELKSVALEIEDSIYYSRTLINYFSDSHYFAGVPQETYRYYLLNSSVTYLNIRQDGTFELDLRDRIPVKLTESVIFSAVFSAAFVGCGIGYIVFNVKKRRNKNAE